MRVRHFEEVLYLYYVEIYATLAVALLAHFMHTSVGTRCAYVKSNATVLRKPHLNAAFERHVTIHICWHR